MTVLRKGTSLPEGRMVVKSDGKMASRDSAGFKLETVHKLLQLYFKDEKIKITSKTLELITEVLNIFVIEAAGRAAVQAKKEETRVVTIEHLEKILPQLLLDM